MGKRPRTPHFISGIGDGNINNNNNNNAKNKPPHGGGGGGGVGGGGRAAPNDDIFGGAGVSPQSNNNNNNNNINSNHNIQNNNLHISKMNNNDNNNIAVNGGGGGGGGGPGSTGTGSNTAGNGGNTNVMIRDRYIRKSRNERLARLEEPLLSTTEHWREVFGSGDPAVVGGIKHPGTTSAFGGVETGHWQASAFAILGMIVVISAIFLHFVSDNTHEGTNTPYHYRRRQRQRRREYKKKKKTDEWSDDEEQNILQNSMHLGSSSSSINPGGLIPDYGVIDDGETQMSSSSNAAAAATSAAPMYPYYYHQPPTIAPRFSAQAYPRRKLDPNTPPDIRSGGSNSKGGGGGNNSSTYGVVPAYKSPSVGMSTPGGGGVHRRGVSPRNSFSSTHSHPRSGQQHQAQQHYVAPSGGHHLWGQSKISSSGSYNSSGGPSPRATPLSGRLRVPTPPDAKELFPVVTATGTSSEHGLHVNVPLPTPPEEDELYFQQQQHKQKHGSESISSQQPTPHRQNHLELNARPLGESSSFPSFASAEVEDGQEILTHDSPSSGDNEMELGRLLSGSMQSQQHHPPLSGSGRSNTTPQHSFTQQFSFQGDSNNSRHHHQRSLLLSPGNYDETPLIGNARRLVDANALNSPDLDVALMPPLGNSSHHPIAGKTTTTMTTTPEEAAMATTKTETTEIPYIPALEIPAPRSNTYRTVPEPPPRSILMDELRLVQMETGNSMHWRSEDEGADIPGGNHADMSEASFADDVLEPAYNPNYNDPLAAGDSNHSESGSNISIPSGDPRKNIPHKRGNLTDDTDASGSLQGRIPFQDLQLIEVIGGGGFGQVWRASWRGTPVAVKVLTGSAQATHVAKAIIEEFKAEINLLKGMRHPNICLYMGACVDPPNRAIITELAANGSVWDALRLPLMPPYVPSDGTQNGCWPEHLYAPDQTHGAPPTSAGMHSPFVLTVPIPPKGTWPWELVKRVACGAARGMAYLHGGKPPVLHRDLKSANLLLDESYTTKVCDFGLSRLKAKERSMTGNCGTVQWMAPEVLANMTYNEKADVYSFGIVLWELLSRECPYDGMTAIQCALAVLNRDKRPDIPKWCPPSLHALIKSCVKKEPDQRPSFTQIILALDAMG